MYLFPGLNSRLNFLRTTLAFFRKHFFVVMGLGLIASVGRVIQLGGFGPVSSPLTIMLEIIIEAARLSLCLFVLGLANVKEGSLKIRRFFTQPHNRRAKWSAVIRNIKQHWFALTVNLIGFALIAWALNWLIDALAYQTCLYLSLKEHGILSPASSEWTILLFFKNLSVIPFTLVFEILLVLWITNANMPKRETSRYA